MSRQLFRSTAVVGAMTLISRIMGFVRDMCIARIFGVDIGTDAFFVAFKIPNFMRRLFAEGAFAQAFVPVLSEYRTQGGGALTLFINRMAGSLVLVTLLVTVLGVFAAPVVIAVFAPGFLGESRQYELSVHMLRITFPYAFFITCVAFAGGILNSHGRFAVTAITPVFLNVCMIVAAIWVAPVMSEPILALAWGVLAAGLVQLIFQFPSLVHLGLLPRFNYGFNDPGVKRVIRLMLPAIFGVSITQINLLLDTLIASFLTAGSVSWLYYSDRLVEFPLGVFGIALATVILPSLSNNHAANEREAFSRSIDWGLRLVLLVGLPASLGLFMLAEPLLSTLFQYKAFGHGDVLMAGKSLRAYSVGLLGFILVKVLVPGFTARKDTRTPVRFGIKAMIANLVLNVMLVFPLAHAGLALATSLGAYLNAGLLLMQLRKEGAYRPEKHWRLFFSRIVFANGIMVACLYHFVDAEQWSEWDAQQRIIGLAIWIGVAIVLYISSLLVAGFRLRQLSER